ncbi:MAG: MBL fold metallo-hydrolase [Deltaproteobacteria bacterium]
MKITKRIHALKIPFTIPVSPEMTIERFAYVYLLFGERIHLIDSGVAGADEIIYEEIRKQGREPKELSSLILTHAHPDHIGAARSIKVETDCTLFAHRDEREWIEDTERQLKERPVPGFQMLVGGPAAVDCLLDGGERLELEKDITCRVIHTPGHSRGSISLFLEEEKSLFTADALALPGDMPIYEDISDCMASIMTLQKLENVENLFSSWEPPIQGREQIAERMKESIVYLDRIHAAVISHSTGEEQNIMELCQKVTNELGLPPFAVNPLVAKAFASSLAAGGNHGMAQSDA